MQPEDVKNATKGRAREHQREIESFVHQHRETKQQKMQREREERRKVAITICTVSLTFYQDYEQLTSYDPWGKPGAGAPGPSTRLINQDTTYRKQEERVSSSYAG